MRTVELGTTGVPVSQLALGAMLFGTRTDPATAHAMLDRYLDAGGGFVDTADCYAWWPGDAYQGGESETVLGDWLRRTGRRDDIFLATKGSGMPATLDGVRSDGEADWGRVRFVGAGGDTLRQALDGSLRRLGVDHVDLYYVHVDDRSTPLEETLEALAGLVAAGKTRFIGWSNVRTWRLERIRQLCDRYGWPAPVALQQEHSYLRLRPGYDTPSIVDTEQVGYLREHPDLTLVAYSPILRGAYERPGHASLTPYAGPDADVRIAAIQEVAADLGATPNQTVLAWMLHRADPVRVPLIGPRTMEQLESVLPALDLKLTEDHLKVL
jgi:aryl-alcohol dehydrogenase-like predicted oxidoreductase